MEMSKVLIALSIGYVLHLPEDEYLTKKTTTIGVCVPQNHHFLKSDKNYNFFPNFVTKNYQVKMMTISMFLNMFMTDVDHMSGGRAPSGQRRSPGGR